MSSAARPRRALLFCPGTERAKIEKASGLGTDAIIIDLEDAAALSRKQEAREITAKALRELDFGATERLVRINSVASGLTEDDLVATCQKGWAPDGYVIPKVESADEVRQVAEQLQRLESTAGLPSERRLLAIVESARGIVRLAEIAEADDRLVALVLGAEDLCGDIGALRTSEGSEILYARSALVLHCAAAGLQAIDTPFVDLHDDEGLRADAHRALTLGFSGKLAIHPRQIAPIISVLTPSEEEVAAARRLVAEHERHQNAGRGVFALDGKMVDMPMVRAAMRVLRRAGETGRD